MPEQSTKPVGATVATLSVIRCAFRVNGPFRLADVVRETKLNRSTAFNILRTLVLEEVLEFDLASKVYRLTDQLYRLVRGDEPLPPDKHKRLQEGMARVAEIYGISVAFWRAQSDILVLAAVAEAGEEVKLTQSLGRTVPILYGAAGRAVAAARNLSERELERLLGQLAVDPVEVLPAFLADLDRARRRGWADDGGTLQPGVKAVAVPVVSCEGGVVGACATLMLRGQFTALEEKAIALSLKQVVVNGWETGE